MTYSMPTEINMTEGMGNLFFWINEVTNNMFGNMLLLSIYTIILIGYSRSSNDWFGGLAVAGFTTFVVSLFFWIGGLVSGWVFGISIVIAILGVVFLLLDK